MSLHHGGAARLAPPAWLRYDGGLTSSRKSAQVSMSQTHATGTAEPAAIVVRGARTHNLKIIPLCPFANSVFKKKPDFADVLYT